MSNDRFIHLGALNSRRDCDDAQRRRGLLGAAIANLRSIVSSESFRGLNSTFEESWGTPNGLLKCFQHTQLKSWSKAERGEGKKKKKVKFLTFHEHTQPKSCTPKTNTRLETRLENARKEIFHPVLSSLLTGRSWDGEGGNLNRRGHRSEEGK